MACDAGLLKGIDGDPDFQEVKGEDSHGRFPSRFQAEPLRIVSVDVFNCVFLDSQFLSIWHPFTTQPMILTIFSYFLYF